MPSKFKDIPEYSEDDLIMLTHILKEQGKL